MHPRLLFNSAAVLVFIVFVISITFFKMVDPDGWWHIRAGQMMWELKGLITIDPFAWTRAGQPYLATHEWMAQLIFAGFHGLGGPSGIVVLRILCALLALGIVLAIDRRHLWPNALLVIAGAIVMRPGFLERPQIFSNILFAATLFIALRLLDTPLHHRSREWLLLGLLLTIQILWVNLHGAEAILTFLVPAALFLQTFFDAVRGGRLQPGTEEWRRLRWIILMGIALLLAMFVSPNLHHNITYLWLLLTDKTATFIKEWSPRPWTAYLTLHGAFWTIAVASLLLTRRKIIAVALLLLGPGILSRMGSRHEVLFTLAALGCTIYALKWNTAWEAFLARLRAKKWIIAGTLSLALLGGLMWIDASYRTFVARNNLRGFGYFAPAKGAADFLTREGLHREKIFNTYAIGNYLLFRRIPVFIDGRNVDYGYDFLKEALDARYSVQLWRSLVERYDFTVAVLEFGWSNRDGKEFDFLPHDPAWPLVFTDDWTAVYVKRIPEHGSLVDRFGYSLLTPHSLADGSVLSATPPAQWQTLQQELVRVIADDPRGINGLLTMGELAAMTGQFDPAAAALQEAVRRAPMRYEPFALAARIAASQEQWQEAALLYEEAIDRTRGLPITLNDAQIAEVYEKAGRTREAEEYHKRAARGS